LQSRLVKQAFQENRELVYKYLKKGGLQSRVAKQAFQVVRNLILNHTD